MCNEQANRVAAGLIRDDFHDLRIPLVFPEGVPNLEPRDSIKITDSNAIVRASAAADTTELVVRRWSWPGSHGKPVYNFRSDGRDLKAGRCLIVADAFYEFTDPPPDPNAPKRRPKSKWAFTKAGEPWFMIAGLWRADPQVGEAYTMLTCAPGPDIAPYHSRQVVVLDRADWARWLDPHVPSRDLTVPSPAGTFAIEQLR